MKRIIFLGLSMCILFSCDFKRPINEYSGKKEVFLELVLGSSKQEVKNQINSLVKKERIRESKAIYSRWNSSLFYEYPFYVNKREHNSVFTILFDSNEEYLKLIEIEIQDSRNGICIEDFRKLFVKKYGLPNDSIISYNSMFYRNDVFKLYSWKLEGMKINIERSILPKINKINEVSDDPITNNFFSITYIDSELDSIDLIKSLKLLNENEKRIESEQKRTEEDL